MRILIVLTEVTSSGNARHATRPRGKTQSMKQELGLGDTETPQSTRGSSAVHRSLLIADYLSLLVCLFPDEGRHIEIINPLWNSHATQEILPATAARSAAVK